MPTRNSLARTPQDDPQLAWQHAASIGADVPNQTFRSLGGQIDSSGRWVPTQAAMPDRDPSARNLIDILGEILTTPKGSGLPSRLRVTSYSPEKDQVLLHSIDKGQPFAMTMKDFDMLHRNGQLQREGVPTEGLGVDSLLRRLQKIIGE